MKHVDRTTAWDCFLHYGRKELGNFKPGNLVRSIQLEFGDIGARNRVHR